MTYKNLNVTFHQDILKGDFLMCVHIFQIYELRVLETKPGNAVSIIECDMNVSFHWA